MTEPKRWVIYLMRIFVTSVVVALGALALYVSFGHCVTLAKRVGLTGIDALSFPVFLDGLDIVGASVLAYDRYLKRKSGLLPWTVLAIGAVASVIANASVAPNNLGARIISGWSALCVTAAIKLLSHIYAPAPANPTPSTADPGHTDNTQTPTQAPEDQLEERIDPETTAPRTENSEGAQAADETEATHGDTSSDGADSDQGGLPDPDEVPIKTHQRRRVRGDVETRMPTTDRALAKWREIWEATRHQPVATEYDATQHGVSLRTLQSIQAAGREGLLNPAVSEADLEPAGHH